MVCKGRGSQVLLPVRPMASAKHDKEAQMIQKLEASTEFDSDEIRVLLDVFKSASSGMFGFQQFCSHP